MVYLAFIKDSCGGYCKVFAVWWLVNMKKLYFDFLSEIYILASSMFRKFVKIK